jgi:hypothetical protein
MSDISPEEFVRRCEKAIEAIALADAHHPDSETELALASLGASLYKNWRPLLPPSVLPDEGLAEVVEDVLQQVRERKREIERAGVGTAYRQ